MGVCFALRVFLLQFLKCADHVVVSIHLQNPGADYLWKLVEVNPASLPDENLEGQYRIRTLNGMVIHSLTDQDTLSIVNQNRGDHRAVCFTSLSTQSLNWILSVEYKGHGKWDVHGVQRVEKKISRHKVHWWSLGPYFVRHSPDCCRRWQDQFTLEDRSPQRCQLGVGLFFFSLRLPLEISVFFINRIYVLRSDDGTTSSSIRDKFSLTLDEKTVSIFIFLQLLTYSSSTDHFEAMESKHSSYSSIWLST